MADLIQLRRGTAAQWTAVNPILSVGEPGAEIDTDKLKIGDGTTAWNSLAYIGGSGSGVADGDYGDITVSSSGTVWTVDAAVLSPYLTTASAAASYQPLDADLTAIAALAGTDNIYYRSGAATWTSVSIGTGLAFSSGTLSASASGGVVAGIDPRSAIYPPFTPSGIDDEFNDGSFSGWTAVTPGSTDPTISETNDNVSMLLPGGGASASLRAFMKSTTVSTGDIIETCVRGMGRSANFNQCGLLMADGDTYGAGSQFNFGFSMVENAFVKHHFTNYSSITSGVAYLINPSAAYGDIFMRLKYEAADTFSGWISSDGNLWINVTGSITRTLTPTHVGFHVSSWGSATPYSWSFRYFKKTT